MRGSKRILLTGATGFLGSHLCDALLERGHHVVALARPAAGRRSRERVVAVLEQLPSTSENTAGRAARLEVIDGDIAQPKLGLEKGVYDRLTESLDEIWHCAASLSFLEEDREAIFRMNLDGTRHVLALASRTAARRLHHVSTAYIAGRRTGVVREDEIDAGQEFKNPYEESKYQAEILIRSAQQQGAVSASVYRPSIVIGDSRSGRATHFHGVYAFIRGLWALAKRLGRRREDGDVLRLDLRIRGSDASTLNFVPVDYVTGAIVTAAAQASSAGKTFHIANPEPTPNSLWKGIVCDQLRLGGIELVGEGSFQDRPMNRLEALFHRQMAFYHPYLEAEPLFDCGGTRKALADTPIECPRITPQFARKMTGWYIDRLNRPPAADLALLEQTQL